jgi:hypothetical protein
MQRIDSSDIAIGITSYRSWEDCKPCTHCYYIFPRTSIARHPDSDIAYSPGNIVAGSMEVSGIVEKLKLSQVIDYLVAIEAAGFATATEFEFAG